MEPLKRQRSLIYAHLCQNGEKWPSRPRLFYSQPGKLPCAWHPVLKPAHLPYPTFLLVQNLSSKQIVPTDNVRPKLHDEYSNHQWLKGQGYAWTELSVNPESTYKTKSSGPCLSDQQFQRPLHLQQFMVKLVHWSSQSACEYKGCYESLDWSGLDWTGVKKTSEIS